MLIKQALMMVALSLPGLAHAQTCQPQNISATTPTSYFTDNHNGTVVDNKTGLMWKKCSEGQAWDSNTNGCNSNEVAYTWQNAMKQAQTINSSGGFASYTDWRLPNINELKSLVEEQCYDPAINLAVFPNASSNWFWSSSPVAGVGNIAWHVIFSDGHDGWFDTYFSSSVRLVRSGQ